MLSLAQNKNQKTSLKSEVGAMRGYKIYLILSAIFLLSSGLIYFLHYYVFQDIHHIFIYMVGDLAFLPLEVFLVVIVIERILARRERQSKLSKLNMVMGAFFSEVGNYLLGRLLTFFDNRKEISQHLNITQNWTSIDFKKAAAFARNLKVMIDCNNINLEELRNFLIQKRPFLLALLENPNLLEHDRFTDLLWAVFHLDEELEARTSLENLCNSDAEHLAGDIQRLYNHLSAEWIVYIEHLKKNYPFLFSLVLRIHPFQEHPSPTVN
ncbi:hypothetical protein ACFLXZ_00975 [Chloroflexota bacterium]